MKCPLKEDNFGRMPDCQPDCAWMMNGVCAVAARYDVDANDEKQLKNDVSAKSWDANDANERQDLEYISLVHEIGTLRAERDRYRELCGKLLDAADDMRRVRDQFDAFTEVD